MLIKAENISKTVGETNILKQVSYTVDEGDYIAIMGPSGFGKSTLLYSLSGMDSITECAVIKELIYF